MVDIAIVVILWAIMYIVAFVFLPAWRKRHDAGKGLYARSQDDNKLSVNYALRHLNCKVKWNEDQGDLVARYDYQGGHFNIRLEKDSPYIRICYLYFMEVELRYLELVRTVANLCNLNAETARIVYNVNDETGMVGAHVVCVVTVTDSTVVEVLERAMDDTFKWRQIFMARFNETKDNNDKAEDHDMEKAQATLGHELALLREQEMAHQEAGDDWHQEQGEDTRLARLVEKAMGLKDVVPIRLAVFADDGTTTLDEADDILNYDITHPLIKDGAFRRLSATARLDFYDPADPVKVRHLTMDFEQEGTTADTLYYRITLSLAAASVACGMEPSDRNAPRRQASVLLGYDLTPCEERMKRFRYLCKEAEAKARSGHEDDMSDEEQLLCGECWYDDRWLAYNGKLLFDQSRFYEAASLFEELYRKEALDNTGSKREREDKHRKTCFWLAACHAGLRQYEKAIYYIQQTEPFDNTLSMELYVNCLVNKGDHRALDIIDNVLHALREAEDLRENDNDARHKFTDEQVEHLYHFLLRRRVYLLVTMRRFEEAERILKQMLNDPQNSDFALKELAYIQRNKTRQTEG
mgnify:FL=1